MHLAAEKCDVEVIEMLVESGWSVNTVAKSGKRLCKQAVVWQFTINIK